MLAGTQGSGTCDVPATELDSDDSDEKMPELFDNDHIPDPRDVPDVRWKAEGATIGKSATPVVIIVIAPH